MKRALAAAALLVLLLPSRDAEAVIPSAFGPIQALLVVLPQLLLALAAAAVALFKPRTYRFLFGYLRAHPALALLLVAGISGAVWGVGRLFRVEALAERGGGAWSVFRGGLGRSGAVGDADGPRRPPRLAWQVGADVLGSGARVDSSPAVVGNRVYFGAGLPAVLSAGTGAIHAVDLDTGGAAWSFTGSGAMQPPLRPVFSSPAVAVENGFPRWLVCGEGYHEDRDCRIVILDLASKPPKLHAAIQTTSHVESSPAIHEGRAYIGAGDDGFWCVDLASGKVAWRIEGDPYYELEGEPPGAQAGKTVTLTGVARRIFDGEHADRSTSVLKLGSGPAERTVTGRLVEAPKDAKRPPGVSRWRIETELALPDCESSPVVVPGDPPRVVFGIGIGGNAVVCADARTGALLWKSPVPYPAFGPPSVADGRVLIGLGNGNFIRSDPKPAGAVVCLNLADGKPLWTVPAGDVVLGAVAVRDGRAYAASRDGKLLSIDVASGKVVEQLAAGAPMVCSPALTATALYATTDAGKLLCFDRAPLKLRWSHPLAPGAQVISSPAVAAGRLLVGTATKGFLALDERPGADGPVAVRPWSGGGGGADRRGVADDLGAPAIVTDEAVLRHPQAAAHARPVAGPIAACAGRVFAVFEDGPRRKLAALGASDAKPLWEIDVDPLRGLAVDADRLYVLDSLSIRACSTATGGPLWGPIRVLGTGLTLDSGRLYVGGPTLHCLSAADGASLWTRPESAFGAPAVVFDLLLSSRTDGLFCLSADNGDLLWRIDLPEATAPTVVEVTANGRRQGRVLVAAGATLHCRSLLDGAPVWQAALDEPAVGPAAATEAFVAVPTAEHVKVYRSSDGKELASLPVGKSPATPAIVQGLIVMAAEQRVAAHDLTSGEWPWNYKDQDHVGRATAGPVVAGETIWVGTSKRGLLGIGVPDGEEAVISPPPALTSIHFFYPGLPIDPAPKEILGGKGRSLAEMSRAGLPVPPGFTISTERCRDYHAAGGKWPDGLEDEVSKALAWLEGVTDRVLGRAPRPLLVAVRSGAAASMPGMMDTVLNTGLHPGLESCFPDRERFRSDLRDFVRSFGETVRGLDAKVFDDALDPYDAYRKAAGEAFPEDPRVQLRAAIEAVFHSWNNDRAIKYRARNNVRGLAGTAVTVMAMFPSERSGILFTEDPNRPDEHRMVIEASTGLGEAIVRGHVEPDTFTLDRRTLEIRERRLGTGETACISDEQLLEVARLGMKTEAHYGVPVDVEWGLAEGRLVLLQSRPVRGLDVARAVPKLRDEEIARFRALAKDRPKASWALHNLSETLPAPTPLTWDLMGRRFMREAMLKLYRDLGFVPSDRVAREGFLELAAGKVYADVERSAELFFDGFPMEYELTGGAEALQGRPTKFNLERAGAGFLFTLPITVARMIRSGRIVKRLERTGLETLKTSTLPAFLKYAEAARAKPLGPLSDAALLAELDERMKTAICHYGAELLKPGFLAGTFHGRLTGTLELALGPTEGRALAARLLAGLEGDKTVEANLLLYRVSRGEAPLDAFVSEFGHRGVSEFELAEPRWREDASYPRQRVEQYRRVQGVSPVDLHHKKREERLAAEAALPTLLAEAGASALVEDVKADLAGAQAHLPWRETCKHWFVLGLSLVRDVLQELAERWDLGRDLYYLERAELDRFGADPAPLRERIRERRLRWQALQKIEMPEVLRADDLEAIGRPAPPAAGTDGAWTGLGVASGTGTGPARILMSPADAGDLGAGYVLVCPTTDPAWTPLFINAAALVVERGGMLSHGAIVARDFGIPAVVLRDATKLLAEGAAVKVDGRTGRVELVRKGAAP